MSKERQRRRAIEAQRARAPRSRSAQPRSTEREQDAARDRQRPGSTVPHKAPKADKRAPVYRQRRFPPLPLALKLVLAAFWLACLLLVALLVDAGPGRIGLMVIATMLLPLAVVLVRDPTRRTGR